MSHSILKVGKLDIKTWFNNSLGLPQGSVRAIIAFAFITTLLCSTFGGVEITEMPEWAIGITGSIIGFYFGSAMTRRSSEESKSSEDKQKTEKKDSE